MRRAVIVGLSVLALSLFAAPKAGAEPICRDVNDGFNERHILLPVDHRVQR